MITSNKLIICIGLMCVFLIAAVGCANEPPNNTNDGATLESYLNNDDAIIEAIKNMPIGVTGPKLIYAYQQYAVILNFNGILIYDFDKGGIIHTIDNMALGLNKIQGSDITVARCNNEKIALGNMSDIEDFAYVYDLENNELFKAEGLKGFETVAHADKEKLSGATFDANHDGNAIYDDEGNIVLLTYSYPDGADSWLLSIWDKEGSEMTKQSNVF